MLPGIWVIMVVRTKLASVNYERFVMSRYGLPMGESIRICFCELHVVTEPVDGYGRPLRLAHLRVSMCLKRIRVC
jgi:hypothetical protein